MADITRDEVIHIAKLAMLNLSENEIEGYTKDMQDILATIVVERQSQKKIIIGSGGSMIKKIGTLARTDIVKFLGNKVYLELFVKVENDWRNKKSQLKEYGYKLEN